MAKRALAMGLVLILATMFWTGATALSSNCSGVLINLAPCLDYIQGSSSTSSTPTSQCCSNLANVVQSSPECLCEAINGGGSGIEINQTKAMALPAACNVQTPPISSCNATSPSDSPTGTPDNKIPSGGGSKTVPSTQGEPLSDGSSIKTSFSLLIFLISAASYITIFKPY